MLLKCSCCGKYSTMDLEVHENTEYGECPHCYAMTPTWLGMTDAPSWTELQAATVLN
jgi:hypothetical protein